MNCKSLMVWGRFVRMQLSPWVTLIQSSHRAIQGCPKGRSRFMVSLTKLNLLAIYDLLDDLIRYPPY
ncbi:hypothetical protein ACQ4M3_21525 [Leptolyngbya sp. AN03gr2]|uniref:hypothetical protein n=1 Tax=unclassified Leptolyngbya TaxID=2650499 RepID=UPI003D31DAE9